MVKYAMLMFINVAVAMLMFYLYLLRELLYIPPPNTYGLWNQSSPAIRLTHDSCVLSVACRSLLIVCI